MGSVLNNWQTSLAGLGAFLVPVVNQVMPLLPPQWAAIASGFLAMLGLFAAKDASAK